MKKSMRSRRIREILRNWKGTGNRRGMVESGRYGGSGKELLNRCGMREFEIHRRIGGRVQIPIMFIALTYLLKKQSFLMGH